MIDPIDFWRDPPVDGEEYSKQFIYSCQPEFFGLFGSLSNFLIRIMQRHQIPLDISILELGANIGRNIHYFRKSGWLNVTGVEINPRAIELSEEIFPGTSKHITLVSAQEFLTNQIDDSYDMLFTQGVLMHIPDDSILDEMSRVSGEYIFINEVEENHWATEEERALKFDRYYKEEFEGRGWTQIGTTRYNPKHAHATARMFRRI